MNAIRYEIDLQDRLMDRAKLVCEAEGMNLDSFLEGAIRIAILDAERRSPFVRDALRDADRYPFVCRELGCGRRFKLKPHLGNHMRSHQDEKYGGKAGPRKKTEPVESPEPYSDPLDDDMGPQGETLEPAPVQEFKLAPGIDSALIEMDDVEQVEDDEVDDEPDPMKSAYDFSADVPDFG